MFELTPYSRRHKLPGSWFRDFFGDNFFSGQAAIKADIFAEEDKLIIEAELAGFDKDEIKVQVNDQQLTILAQRKEITENREENYIRRERSINQVCRTFLIENLDADTVQATFTNGLLRLVVPKPQELQPKTKEVEIN